MNKFYQSLMSVLSLITCMITVLFTTSLLSLIFLGNLGRKGVLYLLFGFGGESIGFNASELSHMADVRGIFVVLWIVLALFVFVLFIMEKYYKAVFCKENYKFMSYILGGIILILIILSVSFDWNSLFLKFHEIFFPQGNYSFPVDSLIKTMYPDSFFFWFSVWYGIEMICLEILCFLGAKPSKIN